MRKHVFLLRLLLVAGCGAPQIEEADNADSSDADTFGAESTCSPDARSTFTVGQSPVGPAFVGFGAQYNQNLYAPKGGVPLSSVAALEPKLSALAPEHVRIFFDSRAFTDPALMDSFVRTVELAERSGATVNVTWWHGPYTNPAAQMQKFADVLVDLMVNKSIGAIEAVTIQNEPNTDGLALTLPVYEQLYRHLDADLRAAGVRDRVKLVGGDLLQNNQAEWFQYMGAHMADVLDGYSVHIYWDYRDTAKLVSRLTEVRQIVNSLPAAARKPLYVTEFGVRGIQDSGEAAPGHLASGQLVERSTTAALQQGWFDILAARLGYVATVRWDAYYAMYDNTPQYFSMIGAPSSGWPTKPSYQLARMLTHVVAPGDRAYAVSGTSSGKLVTAFKGGGETTALVLNNTSCRQTIDLRGMPTARSLYFIVWNGDGSGTLAARPRPKTSSTGEVSVSVPPHGIVALTTRLPGLGL